MSDLTGTTLGRYGLLSKINSGGMGTVYLARENSSGREVAVKVMNAHLIENDRRRKEFIRRFEREARLASALKHPNIVEVLDFGRQAEILYLVLQLCDGGNLEELIRLGPLPLHEVNRLFPQLCDALDFAHRQNIVHRDLKPANVLLDANRTPYLGDFGLARLLVDDSENTPITQSGLLMGTPAYMAPEQWSGALLQQSDIYAMGVILFEMLIGAPPYGAQTPEEYMYRHLFAPLPSICALLPSLPIAVDDVMHRALAKKAADRYQTAMAFVGDFQAALRGESITARPSEDGADRPITPILEPLPSRAIADRDGAYGDQANQADEESQSLTRRFTDMLPANLGERYVGRKREQATLIKLLTRPSTRLVSIYGRGGVGKTSLVCKVLNDLERLATLEPDSVRPGAALYLSANARDATNQGVSLDQIFSAFSHLLHGEARKTVLEVWQDAQTDVEPKIRTLLNALPPGRILLLLDNLEMLQNQDTGQIVDDDLATFIEVALQRKSNLCLVIMSRMEISLPRQLKTWENALVLNEGLSLKESIELLRAVDPVGRAGLRNAPTTQLKIVGRMTAGFPRALEAVAGLLLDNPLYRLGDLLEEQQTVLTDAIVSEIVEHSIARLDPTRLRVMQGLAIFGRPVPLSAVESVLEPYIPRTELFLTLTRLVQACFVTHNRELGTFALHPIDEAYAYSRIPEGSPAGAGSEGGTLTIEGMPYTRLALHQRAAQYYQRQAKGASEWKTLDDLAPQLAEFEHRVRATDYDNAARLLFEIDDRLLPWGQYTRLAAMYEQLEGHLTDSLLARSNLGNLGLTYEFLGRVDDALRCYEQVLDSARQDGNRGHEALTLMNLGNLYKQNRCETDLALIHYEQALAIFQEIENHGRQAQMLANIGGALVDLGQFERALDCYERALATIREKNIPDHEAWLLYSIGEACCILRNYSQAENVLRDALTLATTIDAAGPASLAAGELATTLLLEGQLAAALDALKVASQYDLPENNATIAAIHGIILTRLGRLNSAAKAFKRSIQAANDLLRHSAGQHKALYTLALAHAGMVLMGSNSLDDSAQHYTAARSACSKPGILAAHRRLLEALICCPNGEILTPLQTILED